MNRASLLFLGVLITVFTSMVGLVVAPDWQYRELASFQDDAGQTYPVPRSTPAAAGREVYIDLGCLYCHSQQVRPEGYGSDIARGWGVRRTVARDYLYDSPPLLGTMRTGPDLANIGARQPSRNWQLLHLYDPKLTSPGSIMPRYPFLFSVVREPERPPASAVALPQSDSAGGSWIAPKSRAEWLVEYLRSLDHGFELPEAK
jgi:cytochrome c oxidase cbb3-type subunit 2